MEQNRYNEILFSMMDSLRCKYPVYDDGMYKEIESLIFLAYANKNGAKKVDLSGETTVFSYVNTYPEYKGINIFGLGHQIRYTGKEIEKIFDILVGLTNDELREFYESLMSNKMMNLGKMGGEFSNTNDLNELIVKLGKTKKFKSVIDICAGEGGLLMEASKNGFEEFAGYEINTDVSINCVNRGAINELKFDIKNCDVLKTVVNKEYDLAVCNAPFSLRTFSAIVKDSSNKYQYSDSDRILKADWSFIFKALNSTRKTGKTIALVANGSLFNTPDKFYRKQVIDNNAVEAVIQLPSNILPNTCISPSLLIFSNNNKKIKFVNASDCFIEARPFRRLKVKEILDLYNSEDDERIANIEYKNIDSDGYMLNADKYIGEDLSNSIKGAERLGSHATIIPGFQYTTKNIKELLPGKGNVSVVKITNIENGSINFDEMISIDIDEKKFEKYSLKENDILIATKGTAIKFALVTDLNGRKIVPHNNLSVIRCDKTLNPLYLISFLNSAVGTKLVQSIQTGTIIMNITQKALEGLNVPIIDLDTQEVISSRYKLISANIVKLKKELGNVETKLSTVWEDGVSKRVK